jgi:hypothetical protein
MRKVSFLVLVSILLVSCGGDKKKEAVVDQKAVVMHNFSVAIEGTYKENDTLTLYYTQEGAECTDDQAIKKVVVGSDVNQIISIELPFDVNMDNFRLNLSANDKQQTVILNAIKLKSNKKTLTIPQIDFSKYLNFNSNVSWDDSQKGFKFISTDDGYIPRVLANIELESKLTEF